MAIKKEPPEPPDEKRPPETDKHEPPVEGPPSEKTGPSRSKVPALLPPADVMTEANRVATVLAKQTPWTPALRGASARTPVLVQRVDRDDEFYYVVTFDAAGRISARMALDATTGAWLRVAGIDAAAKRLSEWVDPNDVIRKREGRVLELPGQRQPVTVRSKLFTVSPLLVWKPCQASTTELTPFFVALYGEMVLYIRVDGQLFARLTPVRSG